VATDRLDLKNQHQPREAYVVIVRDKNMRHY